MSNSFSDSLTLLWSTDQEAFDNRPNDVCYTYWREDDPDESFTNFTRRDLEELVREFAAKHNLPVDKFDEKVCGLFCLLDWQHPATLLDEALSDHTIWDEENGEWENATYE